MSFVQTLTNNSEERIEYYPEYYVEKKCGDTWYDVPISNGGIGNTGETTTVRNGSSVNLTGYLNLFFDSYEKGTYRVVRKIKPGVGADDIYIVSDEFTLK